MKKKNNNYYFLIFTIVGTAFGFALKNIPTGLCLSVVIGIALDYQKKMLANTPASIFIASLKLVLPLKIYSIYSKFFTVNFLMATMT